MACAHVGCSFEYDSSTMDSVRFGMPDIAAVPVAIVDDPVGRATAAPLLLLPIDDAVDGCECECDSVYDVLCWCLSISAAC